MKTIEAVETIEAAEIVETREAAETAETVETTTIRIPVRNLVLSPLNVRKKQGTGIEELAALIAHFKRAKVWQGYGFSFFQCFRNYLK